MQMAAARGGNSGEMLLRVELTNALTAWLVIWSVRAQGVTLAHGHRAFRTERAAQNFAARMLADAAREEPTASAAAA